MLVHSFLLFYLNQKLHILLICLLLIFMKSKISSVADPKKMIQLHLRSHTHDIYAWRVTAAHLNTIRHTIFFFLSLFVPLEFFCVFVSGSTEHFQNKGIK